MQLLIGHGQVPTIMPEASYFFEISFWASGTKNMEAFSYCDFGEGNHKILSIGKNRIYSSLQTAMKIDGRRFT